MWPRLALKAIPKGQLSQPGYHLQTKAELLKPIPEDQASPSTAFGPPEATACSILCCALPASRSRLPCYSAVPPASRTALGTGGRSVSICWLNDRFECKNSGFFVFKNRFIIWSHVHICLLTMEPFPAEPNGQIETVLPQSVY